MTTLPERLVPSPLDAQNAFAVISDKGAMRELPRSMSALGQKQTCAARKAMSALLPKADMCGATRDVRYGPEADIALLIR